MNTSNSAVYNAIRTLAASKTGRPNSSIFAGDPIEVSPDTINQDADPIVASLAANDAMPIEQAAQKVADLQSVPFSQQSEALLLPPLAVGNANIVVKPVVKGIPSPNLNYNLQKALLDMSFEGANVEADDATPGTVELSPSLVTAGYRGVPFFQFVISASQLNARAGGSYNLVVDGYTADGRHITTEPYTFTRLAANMPIVGWFIPFTVISSRTLPVLLIFGTDGTTARSITVSCEGITVGSGDRLSVIVPGYATRLLTEVSRKYRLNAGIQA